MPYRRIVHIVDLFGHTLNIGQIGTDFFRRSTHCTQAGLNKWIALGGVCDGQIRYGMDFGQ